VKLIEDLKVCGKGLYDLRKPQVKGFAPLKIAGASPVGYDSIM
jgi:hypothetical protein